MAARSGYTVMTASTRGGRHGERTETVEPRGQKAEAGKNAKEGRRDRSGKVAKEIMRHLGDTVLV
jgi:hypothetical protein